MTDPFALSGYSETREFIAQRSHRGDYQTFTLALPISVLTTLVPTPDPDQRFEDNRQVNEAHARAFGQYWRDNTMWITPPILLDTALDLNASYEVIRAIGTLTVGKLALPYDSDRQVRILDGQHRILGWTLITGAISGELAKARDDLLESTRLENPIGIQAAQERVDMLEQERRRLREEHVTAEILQGVTSVQHRKFFVAIATNAKGISKSRTASFNQDRMMSRLGLYVSENHELLVGLVDEEQDRVSGANPNLISLKNAIELCRESTWGVPSRWTDKREALNNEDQLRRLAMSFLDALCEGSETLASVRKRDITPGMLRQRSMLGSVSMLRVLAGVFADVAVIDAHQNQPEIDPLGLYAFVALVRGLEPHFTYDTNEGGDYLLTRSWLEHPEVAPFFADPGAKAPSGRPQAMKEFVGRLAAWARRGQVFPEASRAEAE